MNIQIQKPIFRDDIKGRKTVPSWRVDDPRSDVTGYQKVDLGKTFREVREELRQMEIKHLNRLHRAGLLEPTIDCLRVARVILENEGVRL